MSNTKINPSNIRLTNLEKTNPPVTKVTGGKDALKNASAQGRGEQINGVDWKQVHARTFTSVLQELLSKKKIQDTTQTVVEQVTAAASTTAQQNPGVSYESTLKPSSWAKHIREEQQQDVRQGHEIKR